MSHSLVFVDFFSFYDFDLRTIEKKIDLLIEIALSTENSWFETAEERADLFLFKSVLMRVLDSAYIIAEKEQKRRLQRALVVLQNAAL